MQANFPKHQNQCSYEESVRWLRDQPEYTELVKLCYLDEDNWAASQRFVVSEEFKEVIKLLSLNSSRQPFSVLDLGCGNGIGSYAISSLGHQVVAVDPDSSLDVGLGAVKKLADRISQGSIITVQSYAESLPFPSETFDIIYVRQSLHHFRSLEQGLAECYRVLKRGGTLLATREHIVSNQEQLKIFLREHILHQLHGGENAYPLWHYQKALHQSGFKLQQSLGHFDTPINHFPTTNADIKQWLRQSLEKKLGKSVALKLSNLLFVEKIYRAKLSHLCNFPGRLHSFLCIKFSGN